MLYRRDPHTFDHLVIDGDEILRLKTRAEALEIANQRHRERCGDDTSVTS